VQGAQISAPQGRYASAVDVLEALGSADLSVRDPKAALTIAKPLGTTDLCG
jgi:hypothetical protein